MTTPSSHFHPQQHQLLLLLLLLPPVILPVILAAAAEAQLPMARPGCPEECGNISIPFPFGIGPDCFRGGFEVLCDDSSDPPRAFLAENRIISVVYYYDATVQGKRPKNSPWPLELESISVATGEARVYAPIVYHCSTNSTDHTGPGGFISTEHVLALYRTPFSVSLTRNVLIGVGLSVEAFMGYSPGSYTSYNELTCHAADSVDSRGRAAARNDSCTGRGCCEATLVPDDNAGKNLLVKVNAQHSSSKLKTSPCSYGMLVEKLGYNFSTPDMEGNKTLLKSFPRGVALSLDFAIETFVGCPPPQDSACVSGNSSCANGTYTYTRGYICKCWDHYAGNPYVPNGCQDIDECKLLENPCSNGGICKNKLGGYDCPCKFGMKDDGKGGTCTPVFPLAAKATVGAIGGILLMVILSFLVILRKEKKKAKEF